MIILESRKMAMAMALAMALAMAMAVIRPEYAEGGRNHENQLLLTKVF